MEGCRHRNYTSRSRWQLGHTPARYRRRRVDLGILAFVDTLEKGKVQGGWKNSDCNLINYAYQIGLWKRIICRSAKFDLNYEGRREIITK
jgi:hypothetical protein